MNPVVGFGKRWGWLIIVAAAAPAGLLAKTFQGNTAMLIVASVLVAAGVVAKAVQQFQETQLRVQLAPNAVQVPTFDGAETIQRLITNTRRDCMSHLDSAKEPTIQVRASGFRASDYDQGANNRIPKRITISEYQDLYDRVLAGTELSERDQLIYEHLTEHHMPAGLEPVGDLGELVQRPDKRSPDQYRDEVEEHLAELKKWMPSIWDWQYSAEQHGALWATVGNGTERPFEKVRVVLRLPPGIEVVDPDDLDEPDVSDVPDAPRPYGKPLKWGDISIYPHLVRFPRPYIPSDLDIKEGDDGATVVTFPEVTLHPRERGMPLSPIYLRATDQAAKDATAVMEATSGDTGTNGRVSQSVAIQVRGTVSAGELYQRGWRALDEQQND